jgi:probable lipoprotein NlpC
MNQLYLNSKFFNLGVMLFFKLKTNQKLILSVLFGAMLLASCSSSKKVTVSQKSSTGEEESLSKKENTSTKVISEVIPAEKENFSKKESISDNKSEKVISTARTFIGTPYKYGGTTRSGMDCSALLIKSFGAVKVNLPRSSEAQSKVGTPIKMSELKPGDLVFFATGNKKKEITHVGLVTDVKSKDNIKFIHASSSLGVVETNLFAEYYQKRFRVARRVIE